MPKRERKIIRPMVESIGKIKPWWKRALAIWILITVIQFAFYLVAVSQIGNNETLKEYMFAVISGISGAFAFRFFEEL